MSADRTRTWILLAGLAVLGLVSLACNLPFLVDRFDCEDGGGTWMFDRDLDYYYCQYPEDLPLVSSTPGTQTALPTETAPQPSQQPLNACLISAGQSSWQYEDVRQDSGTGGTTCNARLVIKNRSDKTISLIAYTAWDNNAMQFNGWKKFLIQPGSQWEERVSLVNYIDGTITYSKVEKILLVENSAACAYLLPDGNESLWESQSQVIEPIPCP